MADIQIFIPKSYFQRDKKHGKISLDENILRLYWINGTPLLCVPYHKANNMPILFDVVGQHSAPIMIHATLSSDIMYTAVHYEINQILASYPKEFLLVHQRYVNSNTQWCKSFMWDQRYETERVNIITETLLIAYKNPASHSCKLIWVKWRTLVSIIVCSSPNPATQIPWRVTTLSQVRCG